MTSTRPAPMVMRVRIGSGPKAEKSGETTQPRFRAPSTAMYSSGMRPASTKTVSPGGTPSSSRTLAKRFEASDSSRYVKSRTVPSRPSQRRARWFARGPSAWRSTASWAMLMVPSGNPSSEARAAVQEKRSRASA